MLKDAGIIDNDTLSMKKKCFPSWNILVAGYSGRIHTVTILHENPEVWRILRLLLLFFLKFLKIQETTITEFKRQVEAKTGVKPEE